MKAQTIYKYFNNYTKKQVDDMLLRLNEDDMRIIRLKYGEDLDKPVYNMLTDSEDKRAYNNLVAKMKRLLENPNIVLRTRKKKNVKNEYKKPEVINYFKSIEFRELLNFLSPKEALIFCLEFDLIDGKHFDSLEIANFLGMTKEEVIDIAKKSLIIYKEKINGMSREIVNYVYKSEENGHQKKKTNL